ncbi:MAG: hypothetical protein AB7G18_04910 [Pyrinomonadaceae bacterium]
MSLQGLVVFLIVLAAIAYVGSISYKKLAAFSPKKACGSDCGCGTKTR